MNAKGVDLVESLLVEVPRPPQPAGRCFRYWVSFAEFEPAMIRERVNSGLARAKGEGKRLGRPPISLEQASAAKAGGQGTRAIARGLGFGVLRCIEWCPRSCRP